MLTTASTCSLRRRCGQEEEVSREEEDRAADLSARHGRLPARARPSRGTPRALVLMVPVKRMVFHEITKDAIQRAVDDRASSTSGLVDAQETRRILDRLYGYEVARPVEEGHDRPVRGPRPVGRRRLVVDRERERIAFRSASYWDIDGGLRAAPPFTATLVGRRRHAWRTGKDFDIGWTNHRRCRVPGRGRAPAPSRRARRAPTSPSARSRRSRTAAARRRRS